MNSIKIRWKGIRLTVNEVVRKRVEKTQNQKICKSITAVTRKINEGDSVLLNDPASSDP